MYWTPVKAPVGESKASDGSNQILLLIERFKTATMQSDKIDSLRTIRDLTKEYQKEVGENALNFLVDAIPTENDEECVQLILESILDAITDFDDDQNKNEENEEEDTPKIAQINTILLFKNRNLFDILLNLFEYKKKMIRYDCIQILLCLMNNNKKEVETRIYNCNAGMQKIIDIMSDKREDVRSDYLLLLLELTSNNVEIQSFFAFQEGFDCLNNILYEEQYDIRSVIICDCLHIMYNVLFNNIVTQKLFTGSDSLKKITLLLQKHYNNNFFPTPQQVNNIEKSYNYIFKIFDVLSSSVDLNTAEFDSISLSNKQFIVNTPNLILYTSRILFSDTIDLSMNNKIFGIEILSHILSINSTIQKEFITYTSDDSNLTLIINKIVIMTVHSHNIEYQNVCVKLFCSIFTNNVESSTSFIGLTITPPPAIGGDGNDTIYLGRIITQDIIQSTSSLLSFNLDSENSDSDILNDPNINIQWYSSRLLEGILEGSPIARELATKIMINTNENNEEIDDENETIIMYLYESLSKALKMSLPLKLIVSLSRLLSTWCTECLTAINLLLSSTDVGLLASIMGCLNENENIFNKKMYKRNEVKQLQGVIVIFIGTLLKYSNNENDNSNTNNNDASGIAIMTKKNVIDMISRYIGLDIYTKHLKSFRSILEPMIGSTGKLDEIYDDAYIKECIDIMNTVSKIITSFYTDTPKTSNNAEEVDGDVIERYKEIIRMQDQKINEMNEDLKRIKELNPESDESKELQKERDKWQEKALSYEEDIKELQLEKEKYESTIKDYRNQIKIFTNNISELEETLKQTNLEKQQLINRMESLEQELNEQSIKYGELIQDKEKSISEMQKEYEEHMNNYSEIIEHINEQMSHNILTYINTMSNEIQSSIDNMKEVNDGDDECEIPFNNLSFNTSINKSQSYSNNTSLQYNTPAINKHKLLQVSSSDSMIIHNKVIDNIKKEEGYSSINNNNNTVTTPINQSSSISLTSTSTTPIVTNNSTTTNNNISITSPINTSSSLINQSTNSINHSLSFTPIKKIDIESEDINIKQEYDQLESKNFELKGIIEGLQKQLSEVEKEKDEKNELYTYTAYLSLQNNSLIEYIKNKFGKSYIDEVDHYYNEVIRINSLN